MAAGWAAQGVCGWRGVLLGEGGGPGVGSRGGRHGCVCNTGVGLGAGGARATLQLCATHPRFPPPFPLAFPPSLPPSHPQMLGMHGTVAANFAVNEGDLLLAFGARFDDRVTGVRAAVCVVCGVWGVWGGVCISLAGVLDGWMDGWSDG